MFSIVSELCDFRFYRKIDTYDKVKKRFDKGSSSMQCSIYTYLDKKKFTCIRTVYKPWNWDVCVLGLQPLLSIFQDKANNTSVSDAITNLQTVLD